jgi:hypothetical protein
MSEELRQAQKHRSETKEKPHHNREAENLEDPLAKVLSGSLRIHWAITSEIERQPDNSKQNAHKNQSLEIARQTCEPIHRQEPRRLLVAAQEGGTR